MDDAAALRQFAAARDPAAFRAVVDRHVHLVYAAARRQLADPAAAQDATQAVFLLVVRKAARLHGPTLAGWLLRTTYFVCRDARRADRRRRHYEREAAHMRPTLTADPSPDDDWGAVRPLLDAALATLGDADRAAVALRFLENRPLRDVGQRLGVSEEAARKRVDRAVGRLRRWLGKRGVAAPAALGALLAANAADAAPPAVVAAAAGAAAAPPAAASLAAGAAKAMAWAQLKLPAAAAAALAITVGGVVAVATAPPAPPAPAVSAAPAALATPTPPPPPPAPAGMVVYRGTLTTPDGRPAGGAAVRSYLAEGFIPRLEWQGATAADGSFVVGPVPENAVGDQRTVIFDAPGYAIAFWSLELRGPFAAFAPLAIRLHPPQSVSGVVTDAAGAPVAGAIVEAAVQSRDPYANEWAWDARTGLAATTDAAGRFRLDRIPETAQLHLTVHHPSYCTWSTKVGYTNGVYPVAAGTDDVEVALQPTPASAHVQLTKGAKPLHQAGVSLLAIGPNRYFESRPTDENGQVDFRGLTPGTWTFRPARAGTLAAGGVCDARTITLEAGGSRLVTLAAGEIAVSGTVYEPGTTRPAQKSVTLETGENGEIYLTELDTDATGRFQISLPPGSFTFEVTWNEGGEWRSNKNTVTLKAGETVPPMSLFAPSGNAIRGQLVDVAGRPLAGYVALVGSSVRARAGPDGHFLLRDLPRETFFGKNHLGAAVDPSGTLGRAFPSLLSPATPWTFASSSSP
jgi:RNA polymerase sigma factor (sigma-70 family)